MQSETVDQEKLMAMIQNLDSQELKRLLEDISSMVGTQKKRKMHKITELKGLGKEIWDEMDAQEYVNEERRSWTD